MSRILPRLTVVVLAAVLLHCGKVAESTQTDPLGNKDAATGTPSMTDAGASSDAARVGLDAAAAHDAEPPNVSCAADASVCDNLPPSTCADDKTVVYFSDGVCVGGTCQWQHLLKECGVQSSCAQGGCTPPTTK